MLPLVYFWYSIFLVFLPCAWIVHIWLVKTVYRGYLFFSVKDRHLFHRVDTIRNIFTSGAATSKNITDGVQEIFLIFHRKKKQLFCLFHAFNTFWEKLYQNPVQFFSIIPLGVPLRHSNVLQFYIKREKLKGNDVIFPSGCEAPAINLGNRNM